MNAKRYLSCGALVALAYGAGIVGFAAEPQPAVSAPGRPRTLSPQVSGAVSATLPKFAVPTKVAETPRPVETSSPSEDVLQLPNMRVTTPQNLPATDYAWLTRKGRMELAMKKYRGLGWGNLFGLNGGIGVA